MDRIHDGWTNTLLSNLKDPTTQQNLGLLKAGARKIVDEFLNPKHSQKRLATTLLPALQEALSGLAKVVVTTDNLRSALVAGGSPATLSEA